MRTSTGRMWRWRDARGQDLIEYALVAGFLAISVGAIIPDASVLITRVFSQVSSEIKASWSQGSSSHGS